MRIQCATAAAASVPTSQRSPRRNARTMPKTATITTGVKTSSPFAGDTSRPACPTPHGSLNRPRVPEKPCRQGAPKYIH